MSCSTFSATSPACRTITTIEPDDTLLSATSSGSTDMSLDESGNTPIPFPAEPAILHVNFLTPKASSDYRFEYLYVDVLTAVSLTDLPGNVEPVVIGQTLYSFTVDLAGIPLEDGYVLRWRVVVKDLALSLSLVDSPEVLRVQLPQNVRSQVISFVHPRSGIDYGFSELRIENLDDDVDTQRIIVPQVARKSFTDFTVGYSSKANTDNYFLVARTP